MMLIMDTTVHSIISPEGQAISNPSTLGGKPVFAGTRVPVAALFDYLADNLSLDYFLETFPSVGREQAIAVLRYGQRRIENELTVSSATPGSYVIVSAP